MSTLSGTPTTEGAPAPAEGAPAAAAELDFEEEEEATNGEETQGIITAMISELRIGMDLTRIAIPAAFLEPRSLLEMYADMNSYPQLFSACADKSADPLGRMVHVLRWYFAAVSNRKGVKKPYNPILGERFDCEWDLGEGGVTSYSAEQVTHHPPRSAYYIENKTAGVYWNGDNCTRSGFYGTSVGVKNEGYSTMWLPPSTRSTT
jgi:hypothetical protein